MSEEDIKQGANDADEEAISSPLPQGLELIINRKTNELIFTDPKGHTATVKATVIEDEEEEDEEDDTDTFPLTPEQFKDVLQRLHDLGLTWTADRIAHVKSTSKESDTALLSPEFEEIQQDYPQLPREITAIAFHYFAGTDVSADIVGDKDVLEKKIEIAKSFYLNDEYRSEFFFKNAIKVPYFSDVDWEVVIKASEKNVRKFPGVVYALLSLNLDMPEVGSNPPSGKITAAVDLALVNKLMASLEEVKLALEGSQKLANVLSAVGDKLGVKEAKDAQPNDTTEKVG